MAKKSPVTKKKTASSAKATVKKTESKLSKKSAPAKVPVKSSEKIVKAKAAVSKPLSPAKKMLKKAPEPAKSKPSLVAVKSADKKQSKAGDAVALKPALMTAKGKAEPKDQGDLLIEKAKEEMSKINSDAKQAEKASKVKPIKIERGNAADEKAKWQELNKRHSKDKAQIYKMTEVFEALKPIQHKVLGWGFVLSNENNRLEVLFENGIKMLISNYKPS